MIHANELRIGNRVLYGTVEILVESIHKDGINLEYSTHPDLNNKICMTCTPFKFLSGIPLTPEILEKCGFKKKNEDGVITFTLIINKILGENEHKLFGIKMKGKETIQIDYTVNRYWASNSIYHLHQLQNLYFTLTGEELTVNL